VAIGNALRILVAAHLRSSCDRACRFTRRLASFVARVASADDWRTRCAQLGSFLEQVDTWRCAARDDRNGRRVERAISLSNFSRSRPTTKPHGAAGIAWQSYGGGVRKAIAGWSPHLAWLAPAPAPSGGSAERFKAVSLALASARQSLDKLSTEINRLEVQGGEAPRRRAMR